MVELAGTLVTPAMLVNVWSGLEQRYDTCQAIHGALNKYLYTFTCMSHNLTRYSFHS